MPKKIQFADKYDIINAATPNHKKSYTVIPHREVIDNTVNLLNASGFVITDEQYRCTDEAQIAQGIYYIKPKNNYLDPNLNSETELGMMFAWLNSYNKRIRFQCAIGGYVLVCNNGMCAGDMMSYARKHTGSANFDAKMQISNQIKSAEKFYKRLVDDKRNMKNITLDKQTQSELLGRLYAEENILETSHLSTVKKEMTDPSYDYQCDQENAWVFYNHVTHALKKSHPTSWLSDLQKFHEFYTSNVLSSMGINPTDSPSSIPEEATNAAADIEAQDFFTMGNYKI
tara:strand:- start:7577 stop:8431 length:855 start_codon:yes stop_codon:yes gene_type:complete